MKTGLEKMGTWLAENYVDCKSDNAKLIYASCMAQLGIFKNEEQAQKPTADKGLVEELSALEHDQWARIRSAGLTRGLKNENGTITIPAIIVKKWEEQIKAKYSELSDEEKEFDRIEARKVLEILSRYSGVEKHTESLAELADRKWWGFVIKLVDNHGDIRWFATEKEVRAYLDSLSDKMEEGE